MSNDDDDDIEIENNELIELCLKRYTTLLFDKYHKKYKRIKTRKIILDWTIFAVSSGGIAGSIITATPLIALVTARGLLLNELAETLKYNKKLVLLKKVLKELRIIINELEGYKRGNEFDDEEFRKNANKVDEIITESTMF